MAPFLTMRAGRLVLTDIFRVAILLTMEAGKGFGIYELTGQGSLPQRGEGVFLGEMAEVCWEIFLLVGSTHGEKSIPLCTLKTAGEGAESAFYLLVLRSLMITEATLFSQSMHHLSSYTDPAEGLPGVYFHPNLLAHIDKTLDPPKFLREATCPRSY
ncbi:hypothetical protein TNCV_3918231 [Trichonephila clavipes]|nr:hypothetical protein TNCV_3918231 [Trichonephila clavipes]